MHTHSYNVLNIDIHILHARYVELGNWWQADNVCSPYTRIYMVTDGNGFLAWHDQKILMEPGYIYIIPASLRFSFGCPDKLYKTFFHISIPTPDGYDLLEQLNRCIVLHASEHVVKITAALAENSVKSIKDSAIYFELASVPFGADKLHFNKHNKKYVFAGGLPGKYCPEAWAQAVADYLCKEVL